MENKMYGSLKGNGKGNPASIRQYHDINIDEYASVRDKLFSSGNLLAVGVIRIDAGEFAEDFFMRDCSQVHMMYDSDLRTLTTCAQDVGTTHLAATVDDMIQTLCRNA